MRSERVRCSHWAMKSTCSNIAGGNAISTFLGMVKFLTTDKGESSDLSEKLLGPFDFSRFVTKFITVGRFRK
jgi:hypothetical protein